MPPIPAQGIKDSERTSRDTSVLTSPHYHILIAEDNLVNQKLALNFVGKLGHSADLAGNGVEVIEKLGNSRYDVILMDLQMPEMDGVETVAVIRQAEERLPVGTLRQPIIAMTAHAMKGDRERCLQQGFDGYIAKPIRLELLDEEIGMVMSAEAPALPAFDFQAALAQLNNDRQLFDELAVIFIDELPLLLAELNTAIRGQSFDNIRHSAHRFKGETLHFVSKPLENCLKKLRWRLPNTLLIPFLMNRCILKHYANS